MTLWGGMKGVEEWTGGGSGPVGLRTRCKVWGSELRSCEEMVSEGIIEYRLVGLTDSFFPEYLQHGLIVSTKQSATMYKPLAVIHRLRGQSISNLCFQLANCCHSRQVGERQRASDTGGRRDDDQSEVDLFPGLFVSC